MMSEAAVDAARSWSAMNFWQKAGLPVDGHSKDADAINEFTFGSAVDQVARDGSVEGGGNGGILETEAG